MRKFGSSLVLLLGMCLGPLSGAQEGHPLVGTWQGDWGAGEDPRNRLIVVLNWDGESLDGIVNPGPNSRPIAAAELDSSVWSVRFEVDMPDASGGSARFVAEGQLENIGSHSRTLSGTWQHGDASGDFTLTRHGL